MKNFDLFGLDVNLNFNGKGKYKTQFGGITSCMLCIIMIYIVLQGIIDLQTKTNKYIKVKQNLSYDPPLIQLQNDKFMFAFKVVSPIKNISDSSLKDRKIFEYIVQQHSGYNGKIINKVAHNNCKFQDFSQISSDITIDQFDEGQINEYQCLQANSTGHQLQGLSRSKNFQFISIQIQRCNSTHDKTCFSDSELKELIKSHQIDEAVTIQTAIANAIIDPNSLNEQQITYYIQQDIYILSKIGNTYIKEDIFIQRQELIQQNSIYPIYSDIFSKHIYNVDASQTRQNYQSQSYNAVGTLAKIYLRASQIGYTYDVSFYSLSEFLSYVGGLSQIILGVFGQLVLIYNQFNFQITLANKMYDIQTRQEQKYSEKHIIIKAQKKQDRINKNIQKFRQKVVQIIHQARVKKGKIKQNNLSLIFEQEQLEKTILNQNRISDQLRNRRSFLTDIFQYRVKEHHRHKLKFTFKYVIYKLFCGRVLYTSNEQVQLIEHSTNIILKDLDIYQIIKRLEDVEKMKDIMFNQKQLKLFEFTPKPKIHLYQNLYHQNTNEQRLSRDIRKPINIQNLNKKGYLKRGEDIHSILGYFRLCRAYNQLKSQSNLIQDKDKQRLIKRLLRLIDQDLENVFQISEQYVQEKIYTLNNEQEKEIQESNQNMDEFQLDINDEQIKINDVKNINVLQSQRFQK